MAIQFVGGASTTWVTTTTNALSLTSLAGGIDTAARTGDLVIAIHTFPSGADLNPGVTTAGYTELLDVYVNGSGTKDLNYSVNTKFMGATPDTSVTFNSAAGAFTKCGLVLVFRGVDTTTPIDVASTTSTATGTGATIGDPAITPVTAGAVIVAMASRAGLIPTTANVTNAVQTAIVVASNANPDANGTLTGAGYHEWSGSGTDNSSTWTFSGQSAAAADSMGAAKLALRPAAVTSVEPGNYNSGMFSMF